jgi:hypothetical protein
MRTIRIHQETVSSYRISLFLLLLLVLCSPMNAISIPPFTYHKSINTTTSTSATTGTTTSNVTESAWKDEVARQQSHRYYIEDGDCGNRHSDDNIVIERMKENEDSNNVSSLNLPAVVGTTTHRMMATANCITNETGLRSAIDNAPNFSSTDIDICRNYIGMRGINIVNKFLHIRCVLPNPTEKCTLDAQLKARHFLIDNATVSFDRMTFMSGISTRPDYHGGALWISSSTIQMNNCHFFANEAIMKEDGYGGAIFAKYSSILLGHITMNNNSAVRIKTRWCFVILS